jgi:hypothetical protein
MRHPHIIFSLLALSLAFVVFSTTSCTYVTVQTEYHDISIDKMVTMKPFKATFDAFVIQDCGTNGVDKEVFVGFTKDDGYRFDLWQSPPTKELIGFGHSLKKGHTYIFPQVFLDYRKRETQFDLKN